ncbi:glycosyltransferase family 2 protein [Dactylosporangium cerinum]
MPAYNESATIADTVRALRRQWSPPIDRIVVVPNNCSDDTAQIAAAAGADVHEFPGHNPHKKAGALNWAITNLLPGLADDDFLLVTDADSILHPDFTQHAVRALTRPRAGAAGGDPSAPSAPASTRRATAPACSIGCSATSTPGSRGRLPGAWTRRWCCPVSPPCSRSA